MRRVQGLLAALVAGCTVVYDVPDDRLVDYYAEVERVLRAEGLMRTDTRPADAAFTADDLVENFTRVALYDEFSEQGGRYVEGQTPSSLSRWESPVRVEIVFGASVPEAQADEDIAAVESFTRQLRRATGHDIAMAVAGAPNMSVFFLNREEQRGFARSLVRHVDGAAAVADTLMNSTADAFCFAFTFGSDRPGVYDSAIILVKAEHRDLMRLSCIQEEMAQAMGLVNDSPRARPSIFNDDDEFALLTLHDEILLRMLYDRRLRPAMTEAEARPLLPAVARDAARAMGAGVILN